MEDYRTDEEFVVLLIEQEYHDEERMPFCEHRFFWNPFLALFYDNNNHEQHVHSLSKANMPLVPPIYPHFPKNN